MVPPLVMIWLLGNSVNDTGTDVLWAMPVNGLLACFTIRHLTLLQ
jgi:hypothetical protein